MGDLLTRRRFLHGLGAGVALTGLSALPGCGLVGASSKNDSRTELWYWNRSIDDALLGDAHKHIADLDLAAQKIGGSYDPKLRTTLAGKSNVPDIAGVNGGAYGGDIAGYFPDADQFLDLKEFGADALKGEYLDWKWQQGITEEGKMIGFPMDTGPTAFMYRADIFEKSGLPTDPDEVAAMAPDWDSYLEMGKEFQAKQPKVKWLPNITMAYTQTLSQSDPLYFSGPGEFVGDQEHVRNAWNNAAKARQMGLTAAAPDYSTDWSAGLTNGEIATDVGAVWLAFIIKDVAADTSGKWRVCPSPGGPGNNGGSFLVITKYADDPEKSFELIKWLQSPANQASQYTAVSLFPSAPAAFENPALRKPDPFFGGQQTIDVFGESAKGVKAAYVSPYDRLIHPFYTAELLNVENVGKDPDEAWDDAVSQARRQLEHVGVL